MLMTTLWMLPHSRKIQYQQSKYGANNVRIVRLFTSIRKVVRVHNNISRTEWVGKGKEELKSGMDGKLVTILNLKMV